MKKDLKGLLSIVALAGVGVGSLLSAPAQAALLATIDGNDCPNVFGDGGFSTCKIPELYDPKQSPVIAKYDFDTKQWDFNLALFPNLSAANFTWVLGDSEGKTGTWTYIPGAGDPLVTFYVAKASNKFNLYSNDGDPNSGIWATPENKGISHLTWYDTGDESSVVPLPAAAWLLLSGLLGLGALGRRKVAA